MCSIIGSSYATITVELFSLRRYQCCFGGLRAKTAIRSLSLLARVRDRAPPRDPPVLAAI